MRPGEQPNSYSDEEDETTTSESNKSSSNDNKDDIKNINSSENSSDKPKNEWPIESNQTDSISNNIITDRLSFIDILFNYGSAKHFNNHHQNNTEFDSINGTNNERQKP